jgi:prolyl-tRNA synthetase
VTQQQTKAKATAIQPTRNEDYAQWYQAVVRDADVAEMSHVRGCMVIKPWGYGIWEQIQRTLDRHLKAAGAVNAYFPLFIPLSYIESEAAHVEGFAKEMAVVTHHRLEAKNGKLVPAAELAEPLIVRPTSETIIGKSMAQWIQSYRDLPMRLNQWANVVRWELRPRVLLRTTEFLWQEGHCAYASHEEAVRETELFLEVYRTVVEDYLAVPVIPGEKTPGERFPGAEQTLCIEAMMQDARALQAGTSHYLGQNFSKALDIRFLNAEGQEENAYTTSWGVSTRLVGALVMTHADDNGLRVPPRVAPHQVVVVPMLRKEGSEEVLAYARRVADELRGQTFADGRPVEVLLDDTLYEARDKKWKWVKRGVPLLLELGPKDMANDAVSVLPRHQGPSEYLRMGREEFVAQVGRMLDEMQAHYFAEAKRMQEERTRRDITTFDEFRAHFAEGEESGSAADQPGFVIAKWCGDAACEEKARDLGVTIRCLPFDQSGTEGACVIDGRPATTDAVFAKAY